MIRFFLAALAFLAALPAAAEPTRFSVEIIGEGERDVILIPGLLSPADVWDGHAPALAEENRVHLVEVAGFGDTPTGANAQGDILPGLIDELADYIAANALKDVHVVGHSMGGFTALNLALDHPDLVSEIMIVDSLPFFSVLMGAADAAAAEPMAAGMRDMMLAQADADLPAPSCERPSMQAQSMGKDPAGQCKIDAYTAQADLKVGAQLIYELATSDVRERLSDLTVPATMLFPYDPPMLPQKRADALYRGEYAAAGEMVTLVPVGNARHFIMFDQPEAFAEALADFLAD